jgi:IPT/TIG domain
MRLRQSSAAQAMLALWNPANRAPTSLMAVVPNGLGPMTRTGNQTKVLVAAGDASGNLSVLNSDGTLLTGPSAMSAGTIPAVAANLDGSRFAFALVSNGAAQIILLDGALNQVAMQPSAGVRSLLFSRDGSLLYASQSAATSPAIQIFDGQTLQAIGQVPDVSLQGVQSEIEDSDDTRLLFGIANRGVSFVDVANPGALSAIAPSLAFPPVVQPAEGPAAGGTSAAIAGENIEATATVIFGSQAATSATVASSAQIQVTSPPSAAKGAVNVTAYFPSGWLALAPDGFSYGPQILQVLPNAVSNLGGDVVQIYGYGLGTDANPSSVTIGGAAATIQKIEDVAAIEPSLGLDSTYPFSLECITMKTPPGTSGKADIVVTSANGSATASKAMQYLQSVQVNANPGLYKFLLYDQRRQFIYLSADDRVDVFDLKAGAFKAGGLPIYCPSRMLAGPCPDADLRGLALTPDGTQLVVADFGSQNIFLLNPDDPGMVSYVPVNASGLGPARVVATSAQTAFVSLVPLASAPGACTGCLSQLNLAASTPTIQPAPQPEVSSMTGTPLLQADASGDHVFLSFTVASGGSEALWTAAAPNDFTEFSTNEFVTDAASSADGTMFATVANGATEIRDAALHLVANRTTRETEQFSVGVSVPGLALHPSGALVYQPFLDGPAPLETSTPVPNPNLRGGVDIFDAHSGRLRLRVVLPEPLAARSNDIDGLHAQFLTVDETGQRLFAITNSGLTVVGLANVPLAIGTLVPENGPAAGGTSITIRGSGFQTGTTATVHGKKSAVTFIDANTLTLVTPAVTAGPQQLLLTNPDGETSSLDAAYIAN